LLISMHKRLKRHGFVQEGYRSTWERVLFGQHRLIDFLRSAKKADGLDGRLDRLTCFVPLITQAVGFDLVETIPRIMVSPVTVSSSLLSMHGPYDRHRAVSACCFCDGSKMLMSIDRVG
jgi:hypothetical protein